MRNQKVALCSVTQSKHSNMRGLEVEEMARIRLAKPRAVNSSPSKPCGQNLAVGAHKLILT